MSQGRAAKLRSDDDRRSHARLVTVYADVYEVCTGSRPPFGGRDGVAVWKLLDAVGLERAESVLRNAFADSWGKRRSIRTVADDPAKFYGSSPTTSGLPTSRAVAQTVRQVERIARLEREEAQEQAAKQQATGSGEP